MYFLVVFVADCVDCVLFLAACFLSVCVTYLCVCVCVDMCRCFVEIDYYRLFVIMLFFDVCSFGNDVFRFRFFVDVLLMFVSF